jgi:predicted Fe-S protein YdhL (DUF1289 family)
MSAPKSSVPSPCISVCSLDEDTGFCRGCYRTGDEVETWERLTDDEKRNLLKRLEARKQQFPGLGAR